MVNTWLMAGMLRFYAAADDITGWVAKTRI